MRWKLHKRKPWKQALLNLKSGRAMPAGSGTTMEEFEQIVDMSYWQEIEKRFEEQSLAG